MEIERTISEKSQIVMPKDVRDYLGLKEGSGIIFEIKDREIILKARSTPKRIRGQVYKYVKEDKEIRH